MIIIAGICFYVRLLGIDMSKCLICPKCGGFTVDFVRFNGGIQYIHEYMIIKNKKTGKKHKSISESCYVRNTGSGKRGTERETGS